MAEQLKDFSLAVDGRRYDGWTSVTVTRCLEQLATSYSLGLSGRCTDETELLPIVEGAKATLEWADRGVIEGFIDESRSSYAARTYSMRVNGRAKTGDLVDCSAIHKGGEWRNRTLLQIAKDLCRPFGISAVAETDVGGRFRTFSLQDGETPFEAIDRGARMRGVLQTTNLAGDVVFARAGKRKTRTVLERGKNIVRGSRTGSWKDRHSEYIVKGQSQGDDSWFGEEAAAQKRIAKDDRINRYRPLIIMAEDQETGRALKKRAEWERNSRYGKGQRVSYTVGGWECEEGLWEPNVLVPVRDNFFRIDRELLLVSVKLSRGLRGTHAVLGLTRPEAFDVLELPPPPPKKDSWL